MIPAPFPADELERIATLRQYAILDSAPESAFDLLTNYAAKQFNVPISLVSLVDTERQWFKSSCGLDAKETPRDLAFCSYTVLSDEVNYIPDASEDERLKLNPLVTGEPHIRFYAGAPLIAPNGQRVGSFCLIDDQPRRDFNAHQQSMLKDLAAMVVEHMEMRAATGVVAEEIETRLIAESKSLATERQMLALAKNAPVGIALINRDGQYLSTSKRWDDCVSRISGHAENEDFFSLIDGNVFTRESFDTVLEGGTAHHEEEAVTMADGSVEYINWEMSPWHLDKEYVEGVVMSATFVTQQVEARKATEAQNELFNAVLQSMKDGVVACDTTGKLTLFNNQTRKMHGLDMTPLPLEECGEFYSLFEADGTTHLSTERIPLFRAFNGEAVHDQEMVIAPKDLPSRSVIAQAMPLYDADKNLIGAVASMSDITDTKQATLELKRSEAHAVHVAYHDTLTGLPNRAHFLKYVEDIGCCFDDQKMAVLFIDLNKFKLINDTIGHRVGDGLLRRAADILTCVSGEDAFVSRIGGDEFVVLKPEIDASEAVELGRVIIDELGEPQIIDGKTVVCGASVGVAMAPDHGVSSEELLRRADMAMYKAKSDGSDTAVMFEAAYEANSVNRQVIEADLSRSLDNNEMEVYYQPIVCSRTQAVRGVEALVRWNHPERGQMLPGDFIPIAEESGFIIELGEWVLRTATKMMADVQDLFLSVNLSPVQFRDPLIVPRMLKTIRDSSFNPSRLEFEITEGLLINDAKVARRIIDAFKAEGIRIALDDFGTGYSSLGYIQNFPFDKVKIDRSFVSKMDVNPQSAAVVQCVVSLASSLGMVVTAEGIETDSHELLLKFIGCQTLQGFKYGKPMPFVDLMNLLGAETMAAPSALRAG